MARRCPTSFSRPRTWRWTAPTPRCSTVTEASRSPSPRHTRAAWAPRGSRAEASRPSPTSVAAASTARAGTRRRCVRSGTRRTRTSRQSRVTWCRAASRHRSGSAASAAPTAGCSQATCSRARGARSSAPSSARCRCSTCAATTSCWRVPRGWRSTATPTSRACGRVISPPSRRTSGCAARRASGRTVRARVRPVKRHPACSHVHSACNPVHPACNPIVSGATWEGCPRVLFTTSTKDDRVHPGHARKMVKVGTCHTHAVHMPCTCHARRMPCHVRAMCTCQVHAMHTP